jgi:hypothetical protein
VESSCQYKPIFTAQGDVISPFILNICYQILILKLELNLQIEKLDILPENYDERVLIAPVPIAEDPEAAAAAAAVEGLPGVPGKPFVEKSFCVCRRL